MDASVFMVTLDLISVTNINIRESARGNTGVVVV
jgi:hypothetical protein